jgi:TRAP-type mannitol/chloroaromatic compound transport system permease large subunit
MLFGLDGVEIGLIIVFLTLFAGIMTGFPVAFAIGGAGVISFAIIAALDSAGLLFHQAIDTGSAEYSALIAEGVIRESISVFRYPELPRVEEALFPGGWEVAMERNISFIVNRMNERVIAGQSIETLLAVLMFVLMGITLERSKIAEELLTTMARVFGPLPGGLAVSIVIVGAFLAASTGIVGATVVTMGLLALPTMLRNNYSPELATGVIAASGTLGQIIPPSIVIVLLGTLVGDLYATGQETRAQLAGCSDALTFLGEPAVLSVGTLFQAALLPGIFLAGLYAAYAFGFALVNPSKAPAVELGASSSEPVTRNEALTWFLAAPAAIVIGITVAASGGLVGSQTIFLSDASQQGDTASLRTNVSEQCQVSMIELHGQDAWDTAVAERAANQDAAAAAGETEEVVSLADMTEEERAVLRAEVVGAAAPIGSGVATIFVLLALILVIARGVSPTSNPIPLIVGGLGIALAFMFDIAFIDPLTSPGGTFLILAVPTVLALYGSREAMARLARNDLLRVVFPPLILIVAVLGSILGGITNPTPAAALGAAGAIMLAAYRKLKDENGKSKIVIWASFAIIIMILLGVNFDLRVTREVVPVLGLGGLCAGAVRLSLRLLRAAVFVLGAVPLEHPEPRGSGNGEGHVDGLHHPHRLAASEPCADLLRRRAPHPAVPAKFRQRNGRLPRGDADPVHPGLRSGFPRDHLHRHPDRGPRDLWRHTRSEMGDDHDRGEPADFVPDATVRLCALLPRGVAPPQVTTGHIYRGVLPFVGIQVVGLALLWLFPGIVTILPDLLN